MTRRPGMAHPTVLPLALLVLLGLVLTAVATSLSTPTSTPTSAGPTSNPGAVADPSYDATYYRDAVGRSGPALRGALHEIISTQDTLSYDEVWEALAVTDRDPEDPTHVIELYSGRSVPASARGGDPDDWNREHVWPRSHGDFGTSPGPGTDTTCAPRTSRSTPPAATSTSTSVARVSRSAPAAPPTTTRSHRGRPCAGTWPG